MANNPARFLVGVYLDYGCQGTNELVEVGLIGLDYYVIRVVSSSIWFV